MKNENKAKNEEEKDNFSKNKKDEEDPLNPFVYYKEHAFSKQNQKTDIENQNENLDKDPRISLGVELIFMLIGTNVLFAYNTFINGLDFFETLFPTRDPSTNIARGYNIAASISYFISLPFILSIKPISPLNTFTSGMFSS